MSLQRVMGIDPGSLITGWGVIESDGAANVYVAHGHIRTRGDSFPARLGYLHKAIGEVLDEHRPDIVAIEQVFISNNPMSALKLGQARGAAISAVVIRDLPVHEYAARTIKQAVVGHGGAEKERVKQMVVAQLGIRRALQVDASDGLAVALCHAHSRLGTMAAVGSQSRSRTRGRGLRW